MAHGRVDLLRAREPHLQLLRVHVDVDVAARAPRGTAPPAGSARAPAARRSPAPARAAGCDRARSGRRRTGSVDCAWCWSPPRARARYARTRQPPSSPAGLVQRARAPRRASAARTRSPRSRCGGRSSATRPPRAAAGGPSGWASARRSIASDDVRGLGRLGLAGTSARAGMLKNRSRTSTCVPTGMPTSRASARRPPRPSAGSPRVGVGGARRQRQPRHRRDRRQRLAAEAQRAQPAQSSARRELGGRVPRAAPAARRPASCRSRRRRRGPAARPPASISTSMRRAPASSAFSTSSLTTDAGRSTTSPAAIWFGQLGRQHPHLRPRCRRLFHHRSDASTSLTRELRD